MRVIAPATMLNFLNLASQSGILIKACPESAEGMGVRWNY